MRHIPHIPGRLARDCKKKKVNKCAFRVVQYTYIHTIKYRNNCTLWCRAVVYTRIYFYFIVKTSPAGEISVMFISNYNEFYNPPPRDRTNSPGAGPTAGRETNGTVGGGRTTGVTEGCGRFRKQIR